MLGVVRGVALVVSAALAVPGAYVRYRRRETHAFGRSAVFVWVRQPPGR
jgi:hypothetical protein